MVPSPPPAAASSASKRPSTVCTDCFPSVICSASAAIASRGTSIFRCTGGMSIGVGLFSFSSGICSSLSVTDSPNSFSYSGSAGSFCGAGVAGGGVCGSGVETTGVCRSGACAGGFALGGCFGAVGVSGGVGSGAAIPAFVRARRTSSANVRIATTFFSSVSPVIPTSIACFPLPHAS